MFKRSVFTSVTPLPSFVDRAVVVEGLQDHAMMIELNPLVINYEKCEPARNAPADEYHSTWYELTDRIKYMPGISGKLSYKACFHDLPLGLQTHVYAPTGLDIREKWTVGGNMPGEPRETMELGLVDAPREGLYLREDVNIYCNVLATKFVKKTLQKAHEMLVDRLVLRAQKDSPAPSHATSNAAMVSPNAPSFDRKQLTSMYAPSTVSRLSTQSAPYIPPPQHAVELGDAKDDRQHQAQLGLPGYQASRHDSYTSLGQPSHMSRLSYSSQPPVLTTTVHSPPRQMDAVELE